MPGYRSRPGRAIACEAWRRARVERLLLCPQRQRPKRSGSISERTHCGIVRRARPRPASGPRCRPHSRAEGSKVAHPSRPSGVSVPGRTDLAAAVNEDDRIGRLAIRRHLDIRRTSARRCGRRRCACRRRRNCPASRSRRLRLRPPCARACDGRNAKGAKKPKNRQRRSSTSADSYICYSCFLLIF